MEKTHKNSALGKLTSLWGFKCQINGWVRYTERQMTKTALEERTKKGDGGAGLGTALANGLMREYLTVKKKAEQRPKAAVPSLWAPGIGLVEDNSSTEQGRVGGRGQEVKLRW